MGWFTDGQKDLEIYPFLFIYELVVNEVYQYTNNNTHPVSRGHVFIERPLFRE